VLIPARFSADEERAWVDAMLLRLAAGDKRRRPSDEQLLARAADLSRRFLGDLAKPASIAWVTNQNSRWGSCTPADATIRISARVKGMPPWVLDYVILHELTHLLKPGHGVEFWSLLESYPRTERARGYLEGVAATAGLRWPDEVTDDLTDDVAQA
jgi:predicted metal-dependent hydrolase